jgi:amino acid adenylation domain-containing protein
MRTNEDIRTFACSGHSGVEARSDALRPPRLDESQCSSVWTTECFHKLFARQAARTPDQPAIICNGGRLTYGQFDARANQLAHYLQALAVGPESVVGIFAERGEEILESLVALLAILKAGGAYLFISPDYPDRWLSFAIRDARVSVVLTFRHLSERLQTLEGSTTETTAPPLTIVCLDSAQHDIQRMSSMEPTSQVSVHNLAYVIYTSGTASGTPKGVLVEHRWLGQLARAQIELFNVQPADHVLQHFWLGFDASISEYATAWLAGATLYPVPRELLDPGPGLVTFLQEHGITLVHTTPSILMALTDIESTSVKTLVVGGELCPAELARQFVKCGQQVITAYGLTETVVCNLAGIYSGDSRNPSLGTPFPHVHVELWDEDGCPVSLGQSGEIVISGPLARGYTDSRLTEARFVRRGRDADRYFRTGDRARKNPDGTFTFEARLDGETKVGGFRVDLQTIEGVLSAHPSGLVRDCTVIVRDDTPRLPLLVAYLLLREQKQHFAQTLHDYLSKELPPYMVPLAYVELEHLPLGITGKKSRSMVDFPMLRAADLALPGGESTPALLRTDVETALARLVSQLKSPASQLDTESVDIRMTLKQLRIESRKIIVFMLKVAQFFGVRLEVDELMLSIEKIAAVIEQRRTR